MNAKIGKKLLNPLWMGLLVLSACGVAPPASVPSHAVAASAIFTDEDANVMLDNIEQLSEVADFATQQAAKYPDDDDMQLLAQMATDALRKIK